ncbi:MAG TPA: DUF6600 domain-containing protein [Pyrinomonadaceae bacterium]|nr:DUF6600 domain-containing protein [Pyrinomonadaceae bacterium]
MRSSRPLFVTLLLLPLTLALSNIVVRAEDDDSDDYDVKARVARISLVSGEATLKRDGSADWEQVRVNVPLVEGDVLKTEREARIEIQVDARNFIRIGPASVLRLVTLRDEGIALSLVEGTLSIRLVKFDREQEYFEVDAPKTTLAAERKGIYRIDVGSGGRVRLTARDGGRARIYSETSGFVLRDGRAAELVAEGTNAGDWELMAAADPDSWDTWIDERERFLAQRTSYNPQYYDSHIWGAEDLYAYGNWVYTNDYGWIWQPHITVINSYDNWTPYRYGHWTWFAPYGWTWVGYEPWGWAPYHYGRWVYHNNYWAWCPRSQYYRHRSWWRPALVAFVSFHFSFGDHICWYPLSYHQRDPYSRRYRGNDRLTPLRRQEVAELRRTNPAYLRAVTAVPARNFGAATARLQPATNQLARRVINAEPLRGNLPARPVRAPGNDDNEQAGPINRAGAGSVTPTARLPYRPTGAATRNPGVVLDDQLRRTTILNGRQPRTISLVEGSDQPEARPTGAVARPNRPMRAPARLDEGNRGSQEVTRPDERAGRPTRISPQVQTSPPERSGLVDRPPATTPAPDATPARSERRESPKRAERPDASEPDQRPARPPQPVERRYEAPVPRSQPAPRYEDPARPSQPPVRSEPPSRTEAPRRSEPPSSSQPPARSEPPPRSEPQRRPEAARPAPREDRPSRGQRKNEL